MRITTLSERARDTWDAFQGVGGTLKMYEATTFDTPAQAYYAGQVWAYNRVKYEFGFPTWPETDYADLDAAFNAYEGYSA